MKRAVVFILMACCAVSALSLAEDTKRSKPPATVSPAQEFSPSVTTPTARPNSTNTTSSPTTVPHNSTTPPHNYTTVPHNSTTPPHNYTTVPHNSTTPHHNYTTVPPNSTTTTIKTTTLPPPGPTAPTSLTAGNYSLKNGTKVCLMAQVALQIRLTTAKANGTFIVQPENTTVEGGCEETTANLTLSFPQGFITFLFKKNVSDNIVYVEALSFNINYPLGGTPGSYTATNKSLQLFPAKIGYSYSCTNESLYVGHDLYLDVAKDRMQAFNLANDKDFGRPEACPADKPDYSVAIGVGVALLVLIVIVVVVYILSRRRRADGYQSFGVLQAP